MRLPELPDLVAEFDWSRTSVGPRESWGPGVRGVVQLVQASALPMLLLLGPDRIQLYNDAYAALLGDRHPSSLGQPLALDWPERFKELQAVFEQAEGGQAVTVKEPYLRRVPDLPGGQQEAFFTLLFTPLKVECPGTLITLEDTTTQVRLLRRVRASAELRAALVGVQDMAGVRQVVDQAAAQADVPFSRLFPTSAPDFPAALRPVALKREAEVLPWPSEADSGDAPLVLALPLDGVAGGEASAVLLLGLNPAIPLDEVYRDFLHSYGRVVVSALARVQAREQLELNRRLDEERAALEAFTAFMQAVGIETDVYAIARHAINVLLARYPHGSAVYYEPEGELWLGRVWTPDLSEEIMRLVRAGRPSSTPAFAATLQAGEAVFFDAWNPQDLSVEPSAEYGMAANIPVILNGEVRGILGVGDRLNGRWRERDKTLLRAVGRGLTLALERAEQTRKLDGEREALAAFAQFTEQAGGGNDLLVLVAQAAEVLHSVLKVRSAVYMELVGNRWKARHVSGALLPSLEATLREGLPADTPNFAVPVQRREVMFLEAWDAVQEGLPEGAPYQAVARYPLLRTDGPVGVLGMAKTTASTWTDRERAVFRAVGDSLRLAVERADMLRQAEWQRQRLADLNAEMGAFITRTARNLESPARYLNHLLTAPQDSVPMYDAATLQEEILRLDAVTRDFRQLSSLEEETLNMSLVPLGELVNEVQAELNETALDMEWRLSPLPIVRGDRELLKAALRQTLAFSLSDTRGAGRIEISSSESEGELRLSIWDDGPGLTPEEAATLFDLQVRSDQSVPLMPVSGLAPVRRILVRHGGWAWAETHLRGANIVLALPYDQWLSEIDALLP